MLLCLLFLSMTFVEADTLFQPPVTLNSQPPRNLNWGISPGAYTGGTELPPQLYGSFGPAVFYAWNQKDGPHNPAGTINEIIGTPNGTTMIRWGKDSRLDGITTVECSTGWGCYDGRKDYGWEVGIIFDMTAGSDVTFLHIWKCTADEDGNRKLELWETRLPEGQDVWATLNRMKDAIDGGDAFDGEIDYFAPPAMKGGIANVDPQYWTSEFAGWIDYPPLGQIYVETERSFRKSELVYRAHVYQPSTQRWFETSSDSWPLFTLVPEDNSARQEALYLFEKRDGPSLFWNETSSKWELANPDPNRKLPVTKGRPAGGPAFL